MHESILYGPQGAGGGIECGLFHQLETLGLYFRAIDHL